MNDAVSQPSQDPDAAAAERGVTAFIDTNLILHFRDPAELPWAQLLGPSDVVLVAGRTLQREINDHAFNQRGRRQQRAKDWARRFADAAEAGAGLELRPRGAGGPRITLALYRRPAGRPLPDDIDPNVPDDLIVADALAYAEAHPDQSVVVLTNDSGMIGTAGLVGLTVRRPDETWALPPEQTPEQREIAKLRTENAALKRQGPQLSLTLAGPQGPIEGHATLTALRRAPLSEGEIDRLAAPALGAHRPVDDFMRLEGGEAADPKEHEPPPDKEVSDYLEAHRGWSARTREAIAQAGQRSARPHAVFAFEARLANPGVEPAQDLRGMIELSDGCRLLERMPGTGGLLALGALTAPPAPPHARPKPRGFVLDLAHFDGLDASVDDGASEVMRAALGQRFFDPLASVVGRDAFRDIDRAIARPLAARLPTIEPLPKPEPPRDPEKFYWRTAAGHREGASAWEFECARFPHQGDPQPFRFALLAPLPEADALRTSIRFRAWASNLRDPLDVTVRLSVAITHESVFDDVEAALATAGWPT